MSFTSVDARVKNVGILEAIAAYGLPCTPGRAINEKLGWHGGAPAIDAIMNLITAQHGIAP